MKKVLNSDCVPLTKTQFLEAISKYLSRRTSLVSQDISNFCICGGKSDGARPRNTAPHAGVELLDRQQKQLEVLVRTRSRTFSNYNNKWLKLNSDVSSVQKEKNTNNE